MISCLEITTKSYGLVKKVNFILTIFSTFADETWSSVSMKNSSLVEYLPKQVNILAAASSFQTSMKKNFNLTANFRYIIQLTHTRCWTYQISPI